MGQHALPSFENTQPMPNTWESTCWLDVFSRSKGILQCHTYVGFQVCLVDCNGNILGNMLVAILEQPSLVVAST